MAITVDSHKIFYLFVNILYNEKTAPMMVGITNIMDSFASVINDLTFASVSFDVFSIFSESNFSDESSLLVASFKRRSKELK